MIVHPPAAPRTSQVDEEGESATEPRNVVAGTRFSATEARYITGAMAERGISTMAEFLRQAAIDYASR